MFKYELQHGVTKDQLPKLDFVIAELEADLIFTPGSQSKIAMSVESVMFLLRAAKDATVARELFESAQLAQEELSETGNTTALPELNKALKLYVELHTIEPPADQL